MALRKKNKGIILTPVDEANKVVADALGAFEHAANSIEYANALLEEQVSDDSALKAHLEAEIAVNSDTIARNTKVYEKLLEFVTVP